MRVVAHRSVLHVYLRCEVYYWATERNAKWGANEEKKQCGNQDVYRKFNLCKSLTFILSGEWVREWKETIEWFILLVYCFGDLCTSDFCQRELLKKAIFGKFKIIVVFFEIKFTEDYYDVEIIPETFQRHRSTVFIKKKILPDTRTMSFWSFRTKPKTPFKDKTVLCLRFFSN